MKEDEGRKKHKENAQEASSKKAREKAG